MPKVSPARLAARREEILAAAVACFARRGFHEATMADIAGEAGITPGAIYRYFPSKDDVVEATAQARRPGRTARYQAIRQQRSTRRILEELIKLTFAQAVRPDASMRLMVQLYGEALHNRQVRATLRGIWDDNQSQIEAIIRDAQAGGDVNPALDAGAVARLLMVAFEGLVVHKTIDPDVDVGKAAEVLRAFCTGAFWRGDRPEPAGTVGTG